MSTEGKVNEKVTFWQALGRIDRRIIYVVLAIVVIVPLIVPLKLMKDVSPRAREVFAAIDNLKDTGKPLMISVDFDPASLPELYPMLISMIRHAFARNIKVLVLGLWPTGTGLGQQALNQAAKEFGKKDGVDYVFLGFKAGLMRLSWVWVSTSGRCSPRTVTANRWTRCR
jgi:hypothetical protein